MIHRIKKILYPSLILIFYSFTFTGNPPSGWYLQNVIDLEGRTISDIHFVDSLTGFMTATATFDSGWVLKTTDGGNNWNVNGRFQSFLTQIQFLNENTGFITGAKLYKTTNGGNNWQFIQLPEGGAQGLYALNEDTIWIASGAALVGGLFRTTNGGINWTQQFSIGIGDGNPDRVFFVNKNLGFMNDEGGPLRRTTNGGFNWSIITSELGWLDIYFENDLTGWKSRGDFKKTTNGGLNWENIPLPTQFTPIEGGFLIDGIYEFQIINKDTIWAAGPYIGYNGGRNRGILYISTNRGQTWGYQYPDTSFGIRQYKDLNFINKKIGWAYSRFQNLGVHTVTGGDTTRIITNIIPISTKIPEKFKLFQNYPNPFNPETNISFSLFETGVVSLTIYDITGKEIEVLVNKTMDRGEYIIKWNANNYSGGVYFYKLSSDSYNESKKMILIK